MIKNIIHWFLYSSADITKYSLSLKAGLPFLVLLGVDKYLAPDQAETLIDSAVIIVTSIGTIVTMGVTMFGIARKVTLTVIDAVRGQH